MKALEFRNVSFGYNGEPVLENITLSVEQGDSFGLIGPNGSGKSTLLKLALGLEKPWKGEVRVFEKKDIDWHRVGYVPQRALFVKDFPSTVFEVASMGLFNMLGFNPLQRVDNNRVSEALREVGLEKQEHKLIGELSGGQVQRAFLARALVGEPDLLLLDEPTTGIDAAQQEKFCCLLERLNEKGITVLMVSHDLSFMSHMVHKVVCLNKTVHYCGHPKKLTAKVLEKAFGHGQGFVGHTHRM